MTSAMAPSGVFRHSDDYLSEWLLRTASLGEFVGMTVSMQRLPCKRLQPFSSSFTALAGE